MAPPQKGYSKASKIPAGISRENRISGMYRMDQTF